MLVRGDQTKKKLDPCVALDIERGSPAVKANNPKELT